MNIIFVSPPADSELCNEKFARVCEKMGHNPLIATQSNFIASYMNKRNISNINFHKAQRDFYKKNQFDMQKFDEYIDFYGIDFDHLHFPEFHRFGFSREHTQKFLYAFLITIEQLFDDFQPDLIVLYDSLLLNLAFEFVANKRNIDLLSTNGAALIPNTHFWEPNSSMINWVDEEFLQTPLSEEHKKEAEAFIAKSLDKKPIIGSPFFRRSLFIPKRLTNFLQYVKRYIQNGCDTGGYSPYGYVHSHLAAYIQRPLKKKYYTKNVDFENDKYFFFPLHIKDDYQVTFRAQQFWNQAHTAKMIANALPEGYILYIKEHPVPIWDVPISWIQEMSQIPNVKILPATYNAHEVIPHAEGIITINSDVGWEAITYEKPVIVLAKPFYSRKGVTIDIEDPKDLAEKVLWVIESQWKPDFQKVVHLYSAVLRSVYPHTFGLDCEKPQEVMESMFTHLRKVREKRKKM